MCGICGVYGSDEAANFCYLMSYALQHRGQESAGMGVSDGSSIKLEKRMGWVNQVFDEKTLQALQGHIAQGHVRYSTSGSSSLKNAQPFGYKKNGFDIELLLSHNGNLVNIERNRELLIREGSELPSDSDSEVLLHLIAKAEGKTLEEKVIYALTQPEGRFDVPKGSYTLIVSDHETLIGLTDGFRPLVLGQFNGAHVLASETVALDLIGAEVKYHLGPGDMFVIDNNGPRKVEGKIPVKPPCIFEYIYFARPDSILWGDPKDVYTKRKKLGARLAKDSHIDADVVIAVPDSGVPHAIGYSQESGIPYEMGLTRNHYIGRTFIEPHQRIRDFGLRIKLNVIRSVVNGKRVIVVDDSIVRGTTTRKLVKLLKDVGAKDVYLRIASPPIDESCYYGIDTPTRKELIASSKSIEETRRYIGADNLAYLSREGMMAVLGNGRDYCSACFVGGIHPVEFTLPNGQLSTIPRQRLSL